MDQLRAQLKVNRPVVVTIDLDYFGGMDAATRAAAFERIWNFVAQRRNLRAVTFAISRPYLTSDNEADALLERIRADGPLAASDFEHGKSQGGWWGWGETKRVLEWLFWAGQITTATRRTSFERV